MLPEAVPVDWTGHVDVVYTLLVLHVSELVAVVVASVMVVSARAATGRGTVVRAVKGKYQYQTYSWHSGDPRAWQRG